MKDLFSRWLSHLSLVFSHLLCIQAAPLKLLFSPYSSSHYYMTNNNNKKPHWYKTSTISFCSPSCGSGIRKRQFSFTSSWYVSHLKDELGWICHVWLFLNMEGSLYHRAGMCPLQYGGLKVIGFCMVTCVLQRKPSKRYETEATWTFQTSPGLSQLLNTDQNTSHVALLAFWCTCGKVLWKTWSILQSLKIQIMIIVKLGLTIKTRSLLRQTLFGSNYVFPFIFHQEWKAVFLFFDSGPLRDQSKIF